MAEYLADLHFHSRFARACSPELTLPNLVKWGQLKGLQILGTGDFTHPLWLAELKEELVETGPGIFRCRRAKSEKTSRILPLEPLFVLTVETSHVYTQEGRGRRIHVLIWTPSFQAVDKINAGLTRRGANLMSDGRPITGLSLMELCEVVFSADERCLIIPAHAWTPWYGVLGDKGGFDSLQEAFGEYAEKIYAVETGLSSDPAMNWRISELENRRIVSFSDAHSPWKLGREATIFEFEDLEKDGFEALRQGILGSFKTNKVSATIEFYPEEGKYHYSGHRKCGIRQSPQESAKTGEICPVCGQRLTVGVLQRVEELATKAANSGERLAHSFTGASAQSPTSSELGFDPASAGSHAQSFARVPPASPADVSGKLGLIRANLHQHPQGQRPSYIMLVPLMEILAEAEGVGEGSKKVLAAYQRLVGHFGSEFEVLLRAAPDEIARVAGEKAADGISRVRRGDLVIEPGYDGVFGKVKIWGEKEKLRPARPQQESLF